MTNRLGPFDTRVTDSGDMLGQNGVNAATLTPDGGHYVWEYHYGHNGEWEGHWVPQALASGPNRQSTSEIERTRPAPNGAGRFR